MHHFTGVRLFLQTALFAGASELRGLSASLEKPAFTYVSFLMKHDDTCLFFLIYIYSSLTLFRSLNEREECLHLGERGTGNIHISWFGGVAVLQKRHTCQQKEHPGWEYAFWNRCGVDLFVTV